MNKNIISSTTATSNLVRRNSSARAGTKLCIHTRDRARLGTTGPLYFANFRKQHGNQFRIEIFPTKLTPCLHRFSISEYFGIKQMGKLLLCRAASFVELQKSVADDQGAEEQTAGAGNNQNRPHRRSIIKRPLAVNPKHK